MIPPSILKRDYALIVLKTTNAQKWRKENEQNRKRNKIDTPLLNVVICLESIKESAYEVIGEKN